MTVGEMVIMPIDVQNEITGITVKRTMIKKSEEGEGGIAKL